jgi:hypothetical protein
VRDPGSRRDWKEPGLPRLAVRRSLLRSCRVAASWSGRSGSKRKPAGRGEDLRIWCPPPRPRPSDFQRYWPQPCRGQGAVGRAAAADRAAPNEDYIACSWVCTNCMKARRLRDQRTRGCTKPDSTASGMGDWRARSQPNLPSDKPGTFIPQRG